MKDWFNNSKNLPYDSNPEKSQNLIVFEQFLLSPLGYVRKNKAGTSFYVFEAEGYKGKIEESGLPVVVPKVQLSRALTKEEYQDQFGK